MTRKATLALANGEVFTLVFGTFARFAPLEIRTGQHPRLRIFPETR